MLTLRDLEGDLRVARSCDLRSRAHAPSTPIKRSNSAARRRLRTAEKKSNLAPFGVVRDKWIVKRAEGCFHCLIQMCARARIFPLIYLKLVECSSAPPSIFLCQCRQNPIALKVLDEALDIVVQSVDLSRTECRLTRGCSESGRSSARGISPESTSTGITCLRFRKACSISQRMKSFGSSRRWPPALLVAVTQRGPIITRTTAAASRAAAIVSMKSNPGRFESRSR